MTSVLDWEFSMAEASLEGSRNVAEIGYSWCNSCILHCNTAKCGAMAHFPQLGFSGQFDLLHVALV